MRLRSIFMAYEEYELNKKFSKYSGTTTNFLGTKWTLRDLSDWLFQQGIVWPKNFINN